MAARLVDVLPEHIIPAAPPTPLHHGSLDAAVLVRNGLVLRDRRQVAAHLC